MSKNGIEKARYFDWGLIRIIKPKRRRQLRTLYNSLRESNQEFFHRMYGSDIDAIPKEKLRRAIEQCQVTIKKDIENIEATFIRIK